jgi:dsRNA-specific ribonuclease
LTQDKIKNSSADYQQKKKKTSYQNAPSAKSTERPSYRQSERKNLQKSEGFPQLEPGTNCYLGRKGVSAGTTSKTRAQFLVF